MTARAVAPGVAGRTLGQGDGCPRVLDRSRAAAARPTRVAGMDTPKEASMYGHHLDYLIATFG
jgi:hypothetical protein